MKTPFTVEQFLEVFKAYNLAVWPMQIILYMIAVTVIVFLFARSGYKGRVIFGLLAFLWFWMGLVYHIFFFTAINKAAWVFGCIYFIQVALFLYYGAWNNKINGSFDNNLFGVTGILFLLYGLVIYPLLGNFLGHNYPSAPTFGLPCPTTVFTFGILLMFQSRIPWQIIVIPLLWSVIGFFAAINFGIKEDIGLLVTGITGFVMILVRNKQLKTIP